MSKNTVKLGEICEFAYGDGLPEAQRRGGEVPVYGSNGIVGWHDRAITKGRTIVVGRKGSIGEIHISETPCWPIDTTYYIDGTKKPCDLDWLYYILIALDLTRLNKSAAVPGLNRNDAYEQDIPFPPFPEQERIAAILAKADRLRRLRRYALTLSETYLQSVFLEMFGDPVRNPMGWETLDFSKVISIISGHGFKRAEYTTNGVRLLQIANVSFQEIIWDALAYLPIDYLERYPKLALKTGDLLMALNRPILGHRVKFAVLKEDDCPAILYQRVGKFVITSDRLMQQYLYGFMMTDCFYEGLKARLAGSDQPYINPTELIKTRFVLPPLPLQQQFARLVHRFERLRTQQREAQRQAEHLFQTLLHRAFRGEG